MKSIHQVLAEISASLPVQWDRYTVTNDLFYVVYGWIQREDNQRDFVIITMWGLDLPGDIFFATSSAKYSEEITRLLTGDTAGHIPCRKIEELEAQAAARIVVNENSFVGFSPSE